MDKAAGVRGADMKALWPHELALRTDVGSTRNGLRVHGILPSLGKEGEVVCCWVISLEVKLFFCNEAVPSHASAICPPWRVATWVCSCWGFEFLWGGIIYTFYHIEGHLWFLKLDHKILVRGPESSLVQHLRSSRSILSGSVALFFSTSLISSSCPGVNYLNISLFSKGSEEGNLPRSVTRT